MYSGLHASNCLLYIWIQADIAFPYYWAIQAMPDVLETQEPSMLWCASPSWLQSVLAVIEAGEPLESTVLVNMKHYLPVRNCWDRSLVVCHHQRNAIRKVRKESVQYRSVWVHQTCTRHTGEVDTVGVLGSTCVPCILASHERLPSSSGSGALARSSDDRSLQMS